MSARRRISIASYKPPHEGVIHAAMTLDCSKVVEYLEAVHERTGKKVTITAFMGAIVGRALRAEPTLNGRIHFGRYIPYDSVNVAFLVQVIRRHLEIHVRRAALAVRQQQLTRPAQSQPVP